jgi:hypothetical protein
MTKLLWRLFTCLLVLALVCEAGYLGEWKHDLVHATYCLAWALMLPKL